MITEGYHSAWAYKDSWMNIFMIHGCLALLFKHMDLFMVIFIDKNLQVEQRKPHQPSRDGGCRQEMLEFQ